MWNSKIITGNFTNIPYSLAMCHELHQCYLRMAAPEEDLLIGQGDSQ